MSFWEFLKEEKDFFIVIGCFILGILLLGYALTGMGRKMSISVEMAEIGALRQDIKKLSKDNEDVIGQATEINRKIARMQRLNNLWWADLIVPDEWEDVKPIAMPGGE